MSQLAYVETFLRQISLRLHEGATYHTLARELVGSLLVEPACAGATRPTPLWLALGDHELSARVGFSLAVPIASVGPFGWLAEAVGEQLLLGRCGVCSGDPNCGSSLGCSAEPFRDPPFVAVRSELLVDGELWVEWLLVAAAAPCEACGGTGIDEAANAQNVRLGIKEAARCKSCRGSGEVPRTDVKAIAGRYRPDRPWRDEDTARVARFRVRAS